MSSFLSGDHTGFHEAVTSLETEQFYKRVASSECDPHAI